MDRLLHMAQSVAVFRSIYIKHSRGEPGGGGSWRFLILIDNYDEGRGIRPADIARYVRCSRAYVSRMIGELSADGLVETRPDERDLRSHFIVCTEKGRRLAQDIMDDYVAVTRRLHDGLGARKSKQLVSLLDEAIAILERANEDDEYGL